MAFAREHGYTEPVTSSATLPGSTSQAAGSAERCGLWVAQLRYVGTVAANFGSIGAGPDAALVPHAPSASLGLHELYSVGH